MNILCPIHNTIEIDFFQIKADLEDLESPIFPYSYKIGNLFNYISSYKSTSSNNLLDSDQFSRTPFWLTGNTSPPPNTITSIATSENTVLSLGSDGKKFPIKMG